MYKSITYINPIISFCMKSQYCPSTFSVYITICHLTLLTYTIMSLQALGMAIGRYGSVLTKTETEPNTVFQNRTRTEPNRNHKFKNQTRTTGFRFGSVLTETENYIKNSKKLYLKYRFINKSFIQKLTYPQFITKHS